jgi:pimeloyl-ACP methyl ester carboxylesterase
MAKPVAYRNVTIDGVRIAYREVGIARKPAVLLLHGVPSSSRMYDGLMRQLGDQFHLIALDYPGFGNSESPDTECFAYTFDHLADVVVRFTDVLKLDQYILFMQNYGAPVGMRVAVARPGAVIGMIFQNGNVYEEGLGPVWARRRLYWADRSAHEDEVRDGQLSLAVTRGRHLGDDPNIEAYDPDLWQDELAFLNRPGEAGIQTELIYDYRNNIASYPVWQAWLREHQLPTLVIWGKHDLAFTVAGARAFQRDLPNATIEILDAGHFAMDTRLDEVVALTRAFLWKQMRKPSAGGGIA